MGLIDDFFKASPEDDGAYLLLDFLRSNGQEALADALEGDGLEYWGEGLWDTDHGYMHMHHHGQSLLQGGCHEDHSAYSSVYRVKAKQ